MTVLTAAVSLQYQCVSVKYICVYIYTCILRTSTTYHFFQFHVLLSVSRHETINFSIVYYVRYFTELQYRTVPHICIDDAACRYIGYSGTRTA